MGPVKITADGMVESVTYERPSFVGRVRRLMEPVLAGRGYELKDQMTPLRRAPAFFETARGWGLKIGTVIDVGVGHGTPWLMESFPDTYTVLVEPNPLFRDSLGRILADRRGEAHCFAAGGTSGEVVMHEDVTVPTNSSMLPPAADHLAEYQSRGWERDYRETVVKLDRLDSLNWTQWPAPFLLKMDCESYELEVMSGLGKMIEQVALVVTEVGIANRYEGSYSFAEFIAAMDAHGLELFDVTDLLQYGRTGHLASMDAVFKPRGLRLSDRT